MELRRLTPALLREWLALFSQTAFPIIGRELTRAWTQRAERFARGFVLADESAPLARAS